MIDAQSLHKSYAGRAVVDSVSLQLQPGRITGLLGPNGAGKSTTVAMLAGLLSPDAGTVSHVDAAGHRMPVTLARRHIGLVPQDLALYEDLPAHANLALFGALYGLAGAALAQRVDAALVLVGLASRAGDKPADFSGGMKRRLNIACALVHDPDVLLLDEPTVGVDPQSRNAIFDNLEALRAAGKALLYTTHYMEEAERLCDRVVVMDHGRVLADDTLAGLRQRVALPQTLQITLAPGARPPDLAALQALPGVRQASLADSRLQVTLDDLAAGSATVLGWLAGHGVAVAELGSSRANLEDMFLALTGRQLRD